MLLLPHPVILKPAGSLPIKIPFYIFWFECWCLHGAFESIFTHLILIASVKILFRKPAFLQQLLIKTVYCKTALPFCSDFSHQIILSDCRGFWA